MNLSQASEGSSEKAPSNTADKNKTRTPSGSEFSFNFGDVRTIFSPERYRNLSESNSQAKIAHPYYTRMNATCSEITNRTSVKAVNNQCKAKSVNQPSKSKQTIIEEEGENDGFYTPPATPVRSKKGVNSPKILKKGSKTIADYLNQKPGPKKNTNNEEEAMDQHQQPTMKGQEDQVKALDLPTVMTMFGRIEQRLKTIEEKQNEPTHQQCSEQCQNSKQVSQLQEDLANCKCEIKSLKRENFLLDRAAKLTLSMVNTLNEKMDRLFFFWNVK